MSIGTGAAIAIGIGAGAGANLLGAKIQAGAAKDAGRTQAASSREALAALQPLVQQALAAQQAGLAQTQQLYAPYSQMGSSSLGALMRGVGLPAAPPTASLGGPMMPPAGGAPRPTYPTQPSGYPPGQQPLQAIARVGLGGPPNLAGARRPSLYGPR